MSNPRSQQTTPVQPPLDINSETVRAQIRLGVDLSVGTFTPTPYAMLPGPRTAYLDDEGLQDRGTFKYACMHAHTHTHTHVKAGYPHAPSDRTGLLPRRRGSTALPGGLPLA